MHESTNRCNGHIQVSPIGKTQKRDRKGCKKGKIEMIMKNSMGAATKAPKLPSQHQLAAADSVFKKKTTTAKLFGSSNHHQLHVINSGSVIKNEIIDDPYTFTDSEPQSVGLGLYSATNCLKKVQSVPSPVGAASAVTTRKVPLSSDASATTAGGKTMRSVATSVDTMPAKTMNQLQADIARNRVAIVKRRKVVHPPPPPTPPPQPPPPPYLQHLLSLSNHNQSSVESTATPTPTPSQLPPPQRTFARVSLPAKRLARQTTWQRERRTRHELLQRIQEAQQQLHVEKRDLFPLGLELSDSEDEDEDEADERGVDVYQRHWFMGGCSAGAAGGGGSARGRDSRLAQVHSELRRRLRQVWRGLGGGGGVGEGRQPPPALVQAVVAAARQQPTATALVLDPRLVASYSKQSRAKVSMLGVKQCSLCQRRALPCTRHCSEHIMYNVDQLLFAYCTAKLGDNTQCRVPVFDVRHQLPLCPHHARSHVNLMKLQPDTTPKRSRKKTKPSTLNRSRSKKKKKSSRSSASSSSSSLAAAASANFVAGGVSKATTTTATSKVESPTTTATTSATSLSNVETSATSTIASGEMPDVFQAEVHSDVPQVEIEVQLDGVEVPEEVLAIASMDPAELASQASKLLEDHDFTNMLLPPDAFNDLFTEDKNGQYEPTKEETEELERALEAVDKDVRSLERTLTGRSGSGLLTLPLSLPIPLESAMTLLGDDTASLVVPPANPPQPPPLPPPPLYTTYSNGFTTSVQTDLRNS